jgi:carbonic anhydrase
MNERVRARAIRLLAAISVIAVHSTIKMVSGDSEFCYSNPDCGPKSSKWTGMCLTGIRQSPIDLFTPRDQQYKYAFLPLESLKSPYFYIQNFGHTVALNFTPDASFYGSEIFPGYGLSRRRYHLANVHFHWGNVSTEGSEHLLKGKAYSMEAHFVHYSVKYSSVKDALDSKDPHALAVVGVFLQAGSSTKSNSALQPAVANLNIVQRKSSGWARVDETLNLTPLLPRTNTKVFHYRGSLTTPECNEQVDWYVFDRPAPISMEDVAAFRTILDGEGNPLQENHRPVQNLNRRSIEVLKL